jgi:hypothetical protein
MILNDRIKPILDRHLPPVQMVTEVHVKEDLSYAEWEAMCKRTGYQPMLRRYSPNWIDYAIGFGVTVAIFGLVLLILSLLNQ